MKSPTHFCLKAHLGWAVSFLEIRLKVSLQKLYLQFWAFAMNLWGFLLFYEDERDRRHQNFIFKLETFDVRFCTTLYDLEHQRPSLETFHQRNRLHDSLRPLDEHFTKQIKLLSKTSLKKNILSTQAKKLLRAKKQLFLFLVILQLHIFFF